MPEAIVKVYRPKQLVVNWSGGIVGAALLIEECVFLENGVQVGAGPDRSTDVTLDGSRGISMQQAVELIMATQGAS